MASRKDPNVTVIGESIIICGDLSGDDDLHVLGQLEGTLKLTNTLRVGEAGLVKADITVREVIIEGTVEGDIRASEKVEVKSSGRMVGNITAPRVVFVDGAIFRGSVELGDVEHVARDDDKAAKTRSPKKKTGSRGSPKNSASGAGNKKTPLKKTVVSARPGKRTAAGSSKKPRFLDPPKAKALPRKNKKRVVVKRK